MFPGGEPVDEWLLLTTNGSQICGEAGVWGMYGM